MLRAHCVALTCTLQHTQRARQLHTFCTRFETNVRYGYSRLAADDYPIIVNIHNSLNVVWPERPRTPEGWAEADRNRNPKCKHRRWVAVVDGEVVGFGAYGQSTWDYHPQRFYVNVEVSRFNRLGFARDPEWQQCQKDIG